MSGRVSHKAQYMLRQVSPSHPTPARRHAHNRKLGYTAILLIETTKPTFLYLPCPFFTHGGKTTQLFNTELTRDVNIINKYNDVHC